MIIWKGKERDYLYVGCASMEKFDMSHEKEVWSLDFTQDTLLHDVKQHTETDIQKNQKVFSSSDNHDYN